MTTRMTFWGAIGAVAALAACASTSRTTPGEPIAARAPAGCVRDTGSRIPAPSGCAGLGSSYTHEDIARTGQTTVSGALGLLDPTVTVH
jgi:hypothetical protein